MDPTVKPVRRIRTYCIPIDTRQTKDPNGKAEMWKCCHCSAAFEDALVAAYHLHVRHGFDKPSDINLLPRAGDLLKFQKKLAHIWLFSTTNSGQQYRDSPFDNKKKNLCIIQVYL